MKPADLKALVAHRLDKSEAFEYRQKFDYVDFTAPDASMASEYIETAAKVVSQIKRYLSKAQ